MQIVVTPLTVGLKQDLFFDTNNNTTYKFTQIHRNERLVYKDFTEKLLMEKIYLKQGPALRSWQPSL